MKRVTRTHALTGEFYIYTTSSVDSYLSSYFNHHRQDWFLQAAVQGQVRLSGYVRVTFTDS